MSSLPRPPILPSQNAPVWSGIEDKAYAPYNLRILQEHSGNRRHEPHASHAAFIEAKPGPFVVANENYGAGRQWPSATQDWKYLVPGSHRLQNHSPAYYEREARKLYRLFLGCEGYQKYRQRQPKNPKPKEQKWPNELEEAFLRALCTYEPMGRKKEPLVDGEGKPMGRNELIAHYIEVTTGEPRTRKQVSSHIQVLKDFVKDQPESESAWSVYKAACADTIEVMCRLTVKATAKSESRAQAAREASKKRSTYPVSQSRCLEPLYLKPAEVSSQRSYAWSKEASAIAFDFVKYDMFIGQNHINAETREKVVDKIHTYTSSSSGGQLHDLRFTDLQQCLAAYPQLDVAEAMNTSGTAPVFAFEASLALPLAKFRSEVELGIQFIFRASRLPSATVVACKTYFFENGEQRLESHGTKGVTIEGDHHEQHCSWQVPFQSSYWARCLHNLGNSMQQADELKSSLLQAFETLAARSAAVGAIKQQVSASIESITAVQEIVASNKTHSWAVATIHWSFKQAAEGQSGQTLWRNVIVNAANATSLDDELELHTMKARCDSGAWPPALLHDCTPPATYPQPPDLQSPIDFHHHSHHHHAGETKDFPQLSAAAATITITDPWGSIDPSTSTIAIGTDCTNGNYTSSQQHAAAAANSNNDYDFTNPDTISFDTFDVAPHNHHHHHHHHDYNHHHHHGYDFAPHPLLLDALGPEHVVVGVDGNNNNNNNAHAAPTDHVALHFSLHTHNNNNNNHQPWPSTSYDALDLGLYGDDDDDDNVAQQPAALPYRTTSTGGEAEGVYPAPLAGTAAVADMGLGLGLGMGQELFGGFGEPDDDDDRYGHQAFGGAEEVELVRGVTNVVRGHEEEKEGEGEDGHGCGLCVGLAYCQCGGAQFD